MHGHTFAATIGGGNTSFDVPDGVREERAIERLTARDIRKVLDVLHDAYALRSLQTFIPRMLSAVTSLIPADIASYVEINRRTWQFTSIATPHGADDFPGSGEIFIRHVPEHPLMINLPSVRDGRAYKISDFLTRRDLHRLALYNEYYRRIGTEFQMAVGLPAPTVAVVGLAISRNRRDCSERERTLLNVLSPHLSQAYVSAEAVTRLERRVGLVQEAAGGGDQEVVIVSSRRATLTATPRGHRWLSAYFGTSPRTSGRIPDQLRRWIEHQARRLASAADVPAPRQALVVAREDGQLEVRMASHRGDTILLLRERPTRVRAEALASLRLSRRESEVLAWVAEGKSNAEIGTILGMSARTVGKHLERVHQKLGVETRTAAAALALRSVPLG